MVAATCISGTVRCVSSPFVFEHESLRISLHIPTLESVCCYLDRQRAAMNDDDDEVEEAYYANSDDDFDALDDFDDLDDGDLFDDDDAVNDDEIWQVAGLLGIGRYSPTWWTLSETDHADGCRCRPMGLLEVLQYHTTGTLRQDALEAHLVALQEVWDHFWSGDGIVNGSSDQINGACVDCLVAGREHLGDVLDEARNLAEELGEALAAFHSHIDIGLDRY